MENFEAQEMEILAMQHIFEERYFEVDGMKPPCGRIIIDVRLPTSFHIKYERIPEHDNDPHQDKTAHESFEVEYLPSITLFFEFPDSYPSHTPPAFLLSCNWLTLDQLSKLSKQLENLWEQNKDAVLFTWIQFLQEEAMDFLNIEQSLNITNLLNFKITDHFKSREKLEVEDENMCGPWDTKLAFHIRPSVSGGSGAFDTRAFNDLTDGKNLPQSLRDFNEKKKKDVFNTTSHVCDICFLTLEGSDFITFRACQHSFCKPCLKSYFEVQIREGNVNALNCPEGKCTTQADGSMVKQVVSRELFKKYDTLLLSRTLEGMTDIGYCPRLDCQCPLLLEPCGRMGSCPKCKFVFCPFCKMAYHGVARCNFKVVDKAELCNRYLESTPEEQAEIEKKYGKKTIKAIIEEALSEEWVECNSKNCPQCKVSIEKTEGCNKMTCFRCGTYFCWLCVTKLKLSNPYSHFQEKGTRCYMRLFPDDYENGFEFEAGEFLRV